MSYGMKTNLAVSFQNSFGTALANSLYWTPFLSEGFAVTKEQLINENMSGVFDEGAHYEGVNAVDGTLECNAHPVILGVLFKAAFGAPTTTQAASASVYSHLFKPRTADFDVYAASIPVTVTKDLGDGGSAHQYYDMVASKVSFGIANGEFLKTTVEFMGGKYSQVAAPAATYPTGKSWTWDVTSISVGGTANSGLSEINIEVDEALENKYTLGTQKTPTRTVRSGRRTVSIDGTLIFDNQTEYQKFIDQSERELIINLKGGTDISSGYQDTLLIKCPLFRYAEFSPVAGGPEKIEIGFSAKGVYSTTSATAIQITLTNTQAAY